MSREGLAVRCTPLVVQLPPEQGSHRLRCLQSVVYRKKDQSFQRYFLAVSEAIELPPAEFLEQLTMTAAQQMELNADEDFLFRWTVYVDPCIAELFKQNAAYDHLDDVSGHVCVQHLFAEGIIKSSKEVEVTIH